MLRASSRVLNSRRISIQHNPCLKHQTPSMTHCFSTGSTTDETSEQTAVLLGSLESIQRDMASHTVPWFIKNMPPSYFRSVNKIDRLQHLNAITALQYAQQPELLLKSPDGKVFSLIHSFDTSAAATTEDDEGVMVARAKVGLLNKILKQIPNDVDGNNLTNVKIFSALDGTLALDVFAFGPDMENGFTTEGGVSAPAENIAAEARHVAYCQDIQAGKYAKETSSHPCQLPHPCFEPDAVKAFLARCSASYVLGSSPRRLATQMKLFTTVSGTEGVAVEVEHGWELKGNDDSAENVAFGGGKAPQHMLTLASANVLQKNSLQKVAAYLALSNIKIVRAHMDCVKDGDNGHVTMSRYLVEPAVSTQVLDWDVITKDLMYLKWIDDRAIALAAAHPKTLSMATAEVIIAYANLLHGVMAKQDSFAYALRRIFYVVTTPSHLPLSVAIAQLFQQKFDPTVATPMTAEDFTRAADIIRTDIRATVESEDAINLLEQMLLAVDLTLRTNAYVPGRYALALRVAPSLMGHGSVGTELPFGVFFIHGRRFNGFHVRFRDISRGGLRVVAPPTLEQHAFESSRQFNEAYSLAFAQQLKNKDIPEGGSKAVILVAPVDTSDDREFVIRKSVKAFADALLDLNTSEARVKNHMVDYYNRDELIYLGPDENIVPADITWMTQRAATRQYPVPNAFISSKPANGINHKDYGVTSEGVAVFTQVALLSQSIDPTSQTFTVKLTGGTDGDVAGNMLTILDRDYGSNVQVVGMADGTATLECPTGLNMTELLRLVNASLPLSSYDATTVEQEAAACDPDAFVLMTTDTPAGIRARNSMHNRVKSDVFLPAGGRPATINENNWRSYLTVAEDGTTVIPSSPLIVEGANLFITPEARQLLFDEAGVVIVKDSSANKCGVICSSYEIIASMLLKPEGFLAIKDELVTQVLTKLRALAACEATLLFREYKKDPSASLPPHSERISKAIIRLHDAIALELEGMEELESNNDLRQVIHDHLPPILLEVTRETLFESIPLPYLKNIVASSLASKIVYNEGLQYAENLPASNLSAIALDYLSQEARVKSLVTGLLSDASIENREEIADLLSRGGIRAGIEKV